MQVSSACTERERESQRERERARGEGTSRGEDVGSAVYPANVCKGINPKLKANEIHPGAFSQLPLGLSASIPTVNHALLPRKPADKSWTCFFMYYATPSICLAYLSSDVPKEQL